MFYLFTCMPCDNKATSETPEHPNVLINYWNNNLKTQNKICRKDSAGKKTWMEKSVGWRMQLKKYQLFDSVL